MSTHPRTEEAYERANRWIESTRSERLRDAAERDELDKECRQLESDLAAARSLNDDYEWAQESKNALVRKIDGILFGENSAKQASLCDLVHPILKLKESEQRLRAALEDMERKVTWNRQIRNSLVKLFKDDGWQDDCTLINHLTNMNFDSPASSGKGEG